MGSNRYESGPPNDTFHDPPRHRSTALKHRHRSKCGARQLNQGSSARALKTAIRVQFSVLVRQSLPPYSQRRLVSNTGLGT